MTEENRRMILELSLNFRWRYSGIVRASYFSVSSRSRSAIKNQDAIIPRIIPITAQDSLNPMVIAAPGSANKSQADSPEARSEKAVTHGPSFRPASK